MSTRTLAAHKSVSCLTRTVVSATRSRGPTRVWLTTAAAPQVHVGVVVVEAGQLADREHKPSAGRERPGAEVRARSLAHHTPILDTVGFVELPRRDLLCHALNVTRWL
jgi:hypothetical protein